MSSSLEGRRVVITGAAANIGGTTAELFGREGAAVVIADINDKAEVALDAVGLLAKADELAANLSHGEQRNLEIGIALATEPKLLCLDEPTAGMSQGETDETRDLIRRIGENLTILGQSEESVCIGDIYRIGAVTFEVSQPRQPCWKLARRWRMHELVGLVVRNGRTGWYLRVLEQGWIEAQVPVTLIERPNPAWSIVRSNEIPHHRKTDLPRALELADASRLADSWVEKLRERAERLRASSALGW